MLRLTGICDGRLSPLRAADGIPDSASGLWIDLCEPTREESESVAALLGFAVPTRQEMAEIEESARLYEENGALVMTAVVINGLTEGRPSRTPVTFVVSPRYLVSVRYANPAPFRSFDTKLARQPESSSIGIFVSLVETIIERSADVLEAVAADLYQISSRIFFDDEESGPVRRSETDLQDLIKQLGRRDLTLAIQRESLLSLSRLLPYFRQAASAWLSNGLPARVKGLERDVRSLAAYEAQLSSEITFLHEATLGLINIDQNRIIKVFSIAAVLFLPPTLVGTIYGMNFENVPELSWAFGYPFSLGLMILSAIVPYYWFRRRGWL